MRNGIWFWPKQCHSSGNGIGPPPPKGSARCSLSPSKSQNLESMLLAEPHVAVMFSCRTLTRLAEICCRTLQTAEPEALNLEKGFLSACAPVQKLVLCVPFCTGGRGVVGCRSKQMSNGPWGKCWFRSTIWGSKTKLEAGTPAAPRALSPISRRTLECRVLSDLLNSRRRAQFVLCLPRTQKDSGICLQEPLTNRP